jgi:hypothetical protein
MSCDLGLRGHCLELLPDRSIIALGGVDKASKRRTNQVWTKSIEHTLWELLNKDGPSGREFAASCLVDNEQLWVCGGRTSPAKGIPELWVFHYTTNQWRCIAAPQTLARWRHTITPMNSQQVLVFGGLSSPYNVLSDPVLVQLDHSGNIAISHIQLDIRPRHSHSITRCGSYLYLFGGTENGLPRDSTLYRICPDTFAVEKLAVQGLVPRYAHSAVYFRNQLVLIGGVSALSTFNEIVTIDLESLTAETVRAELQSPSKDDVVYLQNFVHSLLLKHKAVVIKSEEKDEEIQVYGGGSLCFSFGTLFNDAIRIKVTSSGTWSFVVHKSEKLKASEEKLDAGKYLSTTIQEGISVDQSEKKECHEYKLVCEVCHRLFPSRNQLFRHIKLFGHRIDSLKQA